MLTRRKFLGRFLIGASALVTIAGAGTVFLEPRHLISEPIDVRLKRLLTTFTVSACSDQRRAFSVPTGQSFRDLPQLAQSLIRLLVLTGDFVSHPFGESNGTRGKRRAEPCADVFAQVSIPVVAILGTTTIGITGRL